MFNSNISNKYTHLLTIGSFKRGLLLVLSSLTRLTRIKTNISPKVSCYNILLTRILLYIQSKILFLPKKI